MGSGIQNVHAFPSAGRSTNGNRAAKAIPVYTGADLEPTSELEKAGEVLVELAQRHCDSKNTGLAEVCYLRALDVFTKALPSHHPKTAVTRDNLAMLYRDRGRMGVAESLQRTAVEDLRKHFNGDADCRVAKALRNLAETCLLSGKVQEGLNILSEALDVIDALSADHKDHVVEIPRYHAQVLARLG